MNVKTLTFRSLPVAVHNDNCADSACRAMAGELDQELMESMESIKRVGIGTS